MNRQPFAGAPRPLVTTTAPKAPSLLGSHFRKKARAYLAILSQEEKAILEREALATMPEKLRQQVERNGPGARIVMNLAMERIAIARLEETKARQQPALPSVEAAE